MGGFAKNFPNIRIYSFYHNDDMSTFWTWIYLLLRLSTFWQVKSAFWHVKSTFWHVKSTFWNVKSTFWKSRHFDFNILTVDILMYTHYFWHYTYIYLLGVPWPPLTPFTPLDHTLSFSANAGGLYLHENRLSPFWNHEWLSLRLSTNYFPR